jgi:hypothetical protein
VQPDGEAARTIDKAAEYDSSDRVRSNYAARYSDMVAQKRVKRSRKKSS